MLACWSNFRAASPGVGQRQSDATSGLCHVLTRGIGKNPDTTLLKNGDLDGALADYTEAIRLKPDHASTHYKGLVRQKKSDVDGALADFQKYLDLGGGVRNGDQARLKPGFATFRKNSSRGNSSEHVEFCERHGAPRCPRSVRERVQGQGTHNDATGQKQRAVLACSCRTCSPQPD